MKKRLCWFIVIMIFLLILAFLRGQDKNGYTVDVFDNGYLVKRDTTQIAFIYENYIFGISGDTLKILMRK